MADTNTRSTNKVNVTTHIRTLMANEVAFLTIKFYNMNISFQVVPFTGKDASGRNQYNRDADIWVQLEWQDAASLLRMSELIINDQLEGNSSNLTLMNRDSSVLSMEWKRDAAVTLTFTKDGKNIVFPFTTTTISVTQPNGQITQKLIHKDLMVFALTLRGYLTGINSERHLNKYTEEYVKSLEGSGDNQQQSGGGGGSNYQNQSRGNTNYRGNNNYQRRNYPNNNRSNYQQNQAPQQAQQPPWIRQNESTTPMNDFSIPSQ